MADGEQIISTAVSVSGQLAIEAMKLLATAIGKFLEEMLRRSSAEYQHQKLAVNDIKDKLFVNKLETSASGRVSDYDFVRSQRLGMEWVAVPVSLNKDELREFARIAEKNGVLFHATMRTDYKGENPIYYLSFREKDLPKVQDTLSTLQFERKLRKLDVEIEKHNRKAVVLETETSDCLQFVYDMQFISPSMTKEQISELQARIRDFGNKYGIHTVDQAQELINNNRAAIVKNKEVVRVLETEKAKIQLERKKAEINLCSEAVMEQTFENTSDTSGSRQSAVDLNKRAERKEAQMNFDSAVNRDTNGRGQRSVYICDMANPEHYIHAESKQAIFKGEKYLKTEYTVYDGENKIMECDDGRFEGRTYKDWLDTRSTMKSSLNFSDNVLVFQSKQELSQYQARCKNTKALTEQEKGTPAIIDMNEDGTIDYRDYSVIIKNIKQSGLDKGYTIEEGKEPVQTSTGRTAREVFESEKSVDAAVCQNLSRQVDVYDKLWRIEYEMVNLEMSLISFQEGSIEHDNATSRMESLKTERYDLLKQEKELSEQRASIENTSIAVEMSEENQEVELSEEKEGISFEEDKMDELDLSKVDHEESREGKHNMSIDEVEKVYTEKAEAIKKAKEAHLPIEKTAAMSHDGR